MWFGVVKIGGSLVSLNEVASSLESIVAARAPLVVVPGGGPFADVVRAEQPRIGYSDEAANRMVALAMDQYAEALADLAPALRRCVSGAELARAVADGVPSVWMPSRMVFEATELPPDWDVTSDGVAAWLATELGAPWLAFVKAAPIGLDRGPTRSWLARKLIDPQTMETLAGFPGEAVLIGADALGQLHTILDEAQLRHRGREARIA